jgi:catechol 2,3-dioxygenase-like lactoylglutathione lyase family enzyme
MTMHRTDPRTHRPIGGFRHTGITVKDMDAALTFYHGLLGLDVVSDRMSKDGGKFVGAADASIRICLLALPDTTVVIELLEYRNAQGTAFGGRAFDPGAGHLSFWVRDIDELYKRLVENGVDVVSAPVEAASGRNKFYARDPDGFWLELTAMPEATS